MTYFRSQRTNFLSIVAAFDGDTIKYFLKSQSDFTGKILALEPDPEKL